MGAFKHFMETATASDLFDRKRKVDLPVTIRDSKGGVKVTTTKALDSDQRRP